ncbi:transposase [Serratia nevei]|uniref:transposase n=1 Tax=Serratia nevei TaxID=2703794 RepID=UPI0036B51FCC
MIHHYLDNRTGKHKRQTLNRKELIGRYISHVRALHFKMVRYSGFLYNCKRVMLLPGCMKPCRCRRWKNRRSRDSPC